MNRNHCFNIDEATKYGIEEAIILANIRYWLEQNIANKKNIHENNVWTYNSARALSELFPYMSSNKIQKLLVSMEKSGIIISGCFNKAKYDKTKWYSIENFLQIHSAFLNNESNQNCKIDYAKSNNSFSQNDEPIPDINTYITTDIKKDINTISDEVSSEEKNEDLPIQEEVVDLESRLPSVFGPTPQARVYTLYQLLYRHLHNNSFNRSELPTSNTFAKISQKLKIFSEIEYSKSIFACFGDDENNEWYKLHNFPLSHGKIDYFLSRYNILCKGDVLDELQNLSLSSENVRETMNIISSLSVKNKK